MSSPDRQSTYELIVESALYAIAEASLGDLLLFMTPTSLSQAARDLIHSDGRIGIRPPAAETVHYHFRREGTERAFDREELATVMLDRVCETILEAARATRDAYLAAADRLAESRDLGSVADAIDFDLSNYRPGETLMVDARERLYCIALAMSDHKSLASERLKITGAELVEIFVPIYHRFLAISHRRMVTGFDERDLAILITMMLEGESLHARHGSGLSIKTIQEAVIRMFWAFTVPVDKTEPDIVAELTADLKLR